MKTIKNILSEQTVKELQKFGLNINGTTVDFINDLVNRKIEEQRDLIVEDNYVDEDYDDMEVEEEAELNVMEDLKEIGFNLNEFILYISSVLKMENAKETLSEIITDEDMKEYLTKHNIYE